MKRLTAFFLSCILCCSLVMTGCEDVPEKQHKHLFSVTEKQPATCTKPVTVVETCSCGETRSHTEGEPLGHTFALDGCSSENEKTVIYLVCEQCGTSFSAYPEACEGYPLEILSYILPDCTETGELTLSCNGAEPESYELSPLGHDFDGDPDDYFAIHTCQRENCGNRTFFESDYPFRSTFDCTDREKLDQKAKASAERLNDFLASLSAYSAERDTYDENNKDALSDNEKLVSLVNDYRTILDEYEQNAVWGELLFYVEYTVEASETQNLLASAYREAAATLSDAYLVIWESELREYYFAGFDLDGIEAEIALLSLSSSETYLTLSSEMNLVANELYLTDRHDANYPFLYGEYVQKANELAEFIGYQDHYDMISAESYSRTYGKEEDKRFCDYVKDYLLPFCDLYAEKAADAEDAIRSEEAKALYKGLTENSFFDDLTAREALCAYFEKMSTETCREDLPVLSLYQLANDFFRDGNFYFGKGPSAFTTDSPVMSKPVIYFMKDGYYARLQTFIHEFGHYTDSYYNPTVLNDYALFETHSNGNEFLFMLFLKDWIAERLSDKEEAALVYEAYRDSLLANKISLIRESAFLTECECAVYADYYNADPFRDGISADEYLDLFAMIGEEYGYSRPSTAYYLGTAATYDCYYLSYGLSTLAALGLIADAGREGLDAAADHYFALITYTDKEENIYYDISGSPQSKLDFEEVLTYAGLDSPFEEDLYRSLAAFLEEETA